jgi:hypothetical protein
LLAVVDGWVNEERNDEADERETIAEVEADEEETCNCECEWGEIIDIPWACISCICVGLGVLLLLLLLLIEVLEESEALEVTEPIDDVDDDGVNEAIANTLLLFVGDSGGLLLFVGLLLPLLLLWCSSWSSIIIRLL